MATTNVNIRMDAELKQQFEAFCANVETVAAMEEVRQMKENPSLGKTYTDVDEMMKALLS